MVWLTSTSSMLLFLLLLLSCSAVAEEDNGDGIPDEKDDTNGACAYMDPRTDPNLGPCGFQGCPSLCGNPPTCSVAKTAVNEYDCLNGPSPECCQWNDNELLYECDKDPVMNQLYKAADTCCNEASESCSDDGWPKSCNLGCGAIMIPLMNKCLSSFPDIGLTASAKPLQTSAKLCPCVAEILACDKDMQCDMALDILPTLSVAQYADFFTKVDLSQPNNFLNPGNSTAKLALLKCYQATQH